MGRVTPPGVSCVLSINTARNSNKADCECEVTDVLALLQLDLDVLRLRARPESIRFVQMEIKDLRAAIRWSVLIWTMISLLGCWLWTKYSLKMDSWCDDGLKQIPNLIHFRPDA